jgi:hypothetical protein
MFADFIAHVHTNAQQVVSKSKTVFLNLRMPELGDIIIYNAVFLGE